MAVVETSAGCCSWATVPNEPQFLYSAIDDAVVYQNGSTGWVIYVEVYSLLRFLNAGHHMEKGKTTIISVVCFIIHYIKLIYI